MRGDVLTRSARAFPLRPRGRWSSWSSQRKRKRAQARIDRAVLVEQRARAERCAHSATERMPGEAHRRPWRVT
jgi:hypothetical protein